MKYLIVLVLAFLFGCQQKPTKLVSQEPIVGSDVTAESLQKDKPVILDVRPAFEFNLLHVPGAINVRWEDFSQQSNPKSRGLLQTDLFALARRLALIGIDPETTVVVVGKGPLGAGEEGRVAWTLKVLGVAKVYTLLHTSYREMNPRPDEVLIVNKPYWKPAVNEALSIDYKKFKDLTVKGDLSTVVLDVRSYSEVALQSLAQIKKQKLPVVNIDWKEFFNEKGLPQGGVEKVLTQNNITKDRSIVVISNHGVRSAAVTYALSYLGFKNVKNFAGGYEQWK